MMWVVKRNGDREDVSFDKVLNRLKLLSAGLSIDVYEIAQKVCGRIFDGVKTSELDELAAQMCSSMLVEHPDYGKLASRIIVSNHHKNTSPSFSETVKLMYDNRDADGVSSPLVSDELYDIVMKNKEKLNSYIDYSRDYGFDYFGFKTLERSYLIKVDGVIVERPQHMWMRVALGIHGQDFKDALQTYDMMSKKFFTHATPTLFNAGTPRPQCSSCYLLSMNGDSLHDIYGSLQECAIISKYSGGIGIHMHQIRAKGSRIRGTNGASDGIIPMLRVFNSTARYCNQGGKRNGSIAVYLEPWHADVEKFIELRKNHGNEEDRCRDLFLAMWVPDLFMERVKANGTWSLMCPDKCPGLSDVYGEAFVELYEKYEREGKYNRQIKAQDLWYRILEAQIETGVPYILYKDSVNRKSNQKNLGTIKSSNLCVAGDTMVLTRTGEFPIDTLAGHVVSVWNGMEWSQVNVVQTGSDQSLIKVSFSNGGFLRCTPYHRFWIKSGEESVVKTTQELRIGDEIEDYVLPDRPEDTIRIGVVGIEDDGAFGDTFCFNEPIRHRGVFNGVLTGQCSEIVEYSSPEEIAVCNLASICLPSYIVENDHGIPHFDFGQLHEIAKVITKNLNKVIDRNYYPLEKARRSNLKHRPIGIGIQGLADTFVVLRLPFESDAAKELNRNIFETIYHGALEASMEIAKKRHGLVMEARKVGESPTLPAYDAYLRLNDYETEFVKTSDHPGAYTSFEGSPTSQGLLQFDLWGKTATDRYDWALLKADIVRYGLRNSLLIAPMPTASTAQIMGFNESFEPFTSNIYKRKTLGGEFILLNKYLVQDLIDRDMWNKNIKDKLILGNGSVQNIPEIPEELRELYKTVWEIKQKNLIDMSADRGPFICQTQSLNLFMEEPDFKKLTSMHFYSWKSGLKTNSYYLRSKPRAQTQQFTIDPTFAKDNAKPKQVEEVACTEEACLSCGA